MLCTLFFNSTEICFVVFPLARRLSISHSLSVNSALEFFISELNCCSIKMCEILEQMYLLSDITQLIAALNSTEDDSFNRYCSPHRSQPCRLAQIKSSGHIESFTLFSLSTISSALSETE